jgi:hypothetical protein
MRITLFVGLFFFVLAVIFGTAARRDYVKAQCQWSPAAKTRRRIAIIFAIVGLGLVLWQLTWK